MNYTITQIQQSATPILKRYDVKKAAIFGSYARNEQHRDSDIDMLVEFQCKKSYFDLVDLELELQESIGKKFDCITYKSIHPLLRTRILKEQKPIL